MAEGDIKNIKRDLAKIHDSILSLSCIFQVDSVDATDFASLIDLLADKASDTFSRVELLIDGLPESHA